jgi:hypothetical protein
MATFPGACVSENIYDDNEHINARKWTYYFKILRFLHYGRMNESITEILALFKKYWI